MSDIKAEVQGFDPNLKARDVKSLAAPTDNIYEALAIITKRARQLSVDIKQELHTKLEEFATSSDAIEEISENKEQIEISKFYERLPNPTVIATEQYINGDIHYYYADKRKRND